MTRPRVTAYLLISAAYIGLFMLGFSWLHVRGDRAVGAYCIGGEVGALVLGLLMCWKVLN